MLFRDTASQLGRRLLGLTEGKLKLIEKSSLLWVISRFKVKSTVKIRFPDLSFWAFPDNMLLL